METPENRMPRATSDWDAVAASHLAALPPQLRDELMASARLRHVPAGVHVHREGPVARHFTLVVSGLVRVYVTARDGRTLTVRYARTGSLLGALTLFGSNELPASIQAVVGADLLEFDPALVRRLAERDARVARMLIDELSERVTSFIAEIPGSAFGSVRARVAKHLLDLASGGGNDGPLLVAVAQQELADAVGTSREVVVRALRELRAGGLLETGRGHIRLLDPERLVREWNKGS